MRSSIALLLLFVIVFTTTALSQSIPIGVMPMQYNGSFAGSSGNSRLNTNINYFVVNQSQYSYKRRILRSDGSFDRFYPEIRSGIGVTISNYSDVIESSDYKIDMNRTALRIDIAPKFSIKGKYTISPSFGISIYKSYSNIEPPVGHFENGTTNGLNSRLGVLFNADRYYIGYTISFLSSDFQSTEFMTFNSNLQFGYTFQRSEESEFSFTPQLMIFLRDPDEYYQENITSNIKYNLGFRYGQFLAGVINSLRSEIVPTGFQFGWQNNGWRILSSHEFDFRGYKLYSPSLSLRYIFNQDKKSIHIYDQNF